MISKWKILQELPAQNTHCHKSYILCQDVLLLYWIWNCLQWGSCYSIFSFMCMICRSLFVLLSFFLLAIVLSVLLRFTVSDYPFGIFKLFFQKQLQNNYEIIQIIFNLFSFSTFVMPFLLKELELWCSTPLSTIFSFKTFKDN